MYLWLAMCVNAVAVVTAVFAGLIYICVFGDRVGALGVGVLSFLVCRYLCFLGVVVFDGVTLYVLFAFLFGSAVFLVVWVFLRVGSPMFVNGLLIRAGSVLACSVLVVSLWLIGRLSLSAVVSYLVFFGLFAMAWFRFDWRLFVLGLGFGLGCMSDVRELTVLFIPWVGGELPWMRVLYEQFMIWVALCVLLVAGRYVRVDRRLVVLGVVGVTVANLAQLWAVTCVNRVFAWVPSVCVPWASIIPDWFKPAFIEWTKLLIRLTPVPLVMGFRPVIKAEGGKR